MSFWRQFVIENETQSDENLIIFLDNAMKIPWLLIPFIYIVQSFYMEINLNKMTSTIHWIAAQAKYEQGRENYQEVDKIFVHSNT